MKKKVKNNAANYVQMNIIIQFSKIHYKEF